MRMKRNTKRSVTAAMKGEPTLENLIGIVKSWIRLIDYAKANGNKYPTATLSDLKASMTGVLKDYGVTAACNGKKSVNASKYRAIKADVDYFQLAVDVFNNSLARLNEYFKGEVTFKAVVGDVFGAKHTGLYEDDGEAFMLDLQNLVNANGYSVLVNDYLTEYLQHPLYLAVINGTQEQYISEYISGEDMDNIDPTVAYGMEDEWWNTFNYDCYNLAWEIADTIAKYLTNFSMIVEDTDVAFYEDNAGEIELTEDYGDWIIE